MGSRRSPTIIRARAASASEPPGSKIARAICSRSASRSRGAEAEPPAQAVPRGTPDLRHRHRARHHPRALTNVADRAVVEAPQGSRRGYRVAVREVQDQVGHQGGPAGLVGGAEAFARVAVEVLEE